MLHIHSYAAENSEDRAGVIDWQVGLM
jgi:hypothetical protein